MWVERARSARSQSHCRSPAVGSDVVLRFAPPVVGGRGGRRQLCFLRKNAVYRMAFIAIALGSNLAWGLTGVWSLPCLERLLKQV